MINLHEGIKKSTLRVYRSGAEAVHKFTAEGSAVHKFTAEGSAVHKFTAEGSAVEAYGLPKDVSPNTLHIVFEDEQKKKRPRPCERMRMLNPIPCLLSENVLAGKTVSVKEVRRDAGSVFDVMEGLVYAVHGGEIVFRHGENRITEVRSVSMLSTSELSASELARLKDVGAVSFRVPSGEISPADVRLSYMTRTIYWNDSYRVVMGDSEASEFTCDLEHRVWLHNESGSEIGHDKIAFMDSDQWIEIPVSGEGRARVKTVGLESAARPMMALAQSAEGSEEYTAETETVPLAETLQIYADNKKERLGNGLTESILIHDARDIKSRLVFFVSLDNWGSSVVNYELRLRDYEEYVSMRSDFLVYAMKPKKGEEEEEEPILVTAARAADYYYYGAGRKSMTAAQSSVDSADEVILELGRVTQVRITNSSSTGRVPVPGEVLERDTVRATIRNYRQSAVDFQLRTNLRAREANSVAISVWDAKIGPVNKILLREDKDMTMMKGGLRAYNIKLYANSVSEVEAVYVLKPKRF